MGRKSIKERLQRAKTLEDQKLIALDWAQNRQKDIEETILLASRALGQGDQNEAGRYLGQLRGISDKLFVGLKTVIDALSDDEELG